MGGLTGGGGGPQRIIVKCQEGGDGQYVNGDAVETRIVPVFAPGPSSSASSWGDWQAYMRVPFALSIGAFRVGVNWNTMTAGNVTVRIVDGNGNVYASADIPNGFTGIQGGDVHIVNLPLSHDILDCVWAEVICDGSGNAGENCGINSLGLEVS